MSEEARLKTLGHKRLFLSRIIDVMILILILVVAFTSPQGTSSNHVETEYYIRTYKILLTDETVKEITIIIPNASYQKYKKSGHNPRSLSSYVQTFVTYQDKVIVDIANQIRKHLKDPEDIANSVLQIVHQLNYTESKPPKYPVETVVDGSGDCDSFSILAAALMKAAGLDVIVIFYPKHAQVGVALYRPQNSRNSTAWSFQYNGWNSYFSKYHGRLFYVGECTAQDSDWRDSWRVGEMPEDLLGQPSVLIAVDS